MDDGSIDAYLCAFSAISDTQFSTVRWVILCSSLLALPQHRGKIPHSTVKKDPVFFGAVRHQNAYKNTGSFSDYYSHMPWLVPFQSPRGLCEERSLLAVKTRRFGRSGT